MIQALMTYGALSAKARALYGKRLRLSDFHHMAALSSEQEVLDYLRQQPGWTAAVARLTSGYTGYIGRMELEGALWDQVRAEYESILHFAPRQDKALMAFPVLLAEQRAILAALRRLKAGAVRDTIVTNRLLAHGSLDAKALASCSDFDGLLAAAQGTIYAPALRRIRPQDGSLPDYTGAEVLLRSTYFSHVLRLIHKQYAGETQKVLLRLYGEQIDLLNLIHILRLKAYFPDQPCLGVLFPFNYRLRPDMIRTLCQAPDVSAVFELLRATPYASSFENVQVTEVEDYYRRALYTFCRRQLTGGQPSIYTAVAYLNLKEQEARALVTVIESVKYGAAYDDSFARLIGA